MKNILEYAVKQSKGKFLSVKFRKKDGTIRDLVGRINVNYKGEKSPERLDGGGQQYFLLWEPRVRGFRRVNANQILQLKSGGVVIYDKDNCRVPELDKSYATA